MRHVIGAAGEAEDEVVEREDGDAAQGPLHGKPVDGDVISSTVSKTKGTSAAFIKELMRRSAQFHFENADDGRLRSSSVDSALEEMVFTGGALNLKLLGGTGSELAGMRSSFVVSSN